MKEQLEEQEREKDRQAQEMLTLQDNLKRLEKETKRKNEDHDKAKKVLSPS